MGKTNAIKEKQRNTAIHLLTFIGGYVARKQTDEHCLSGQPEDLSPDIQASTASLNRGDLISPSTNFFILLLHIFLFFKNNTEVSCRKRFITIFSDFPSLFHLNMTISKAALRRFVNILRVAREVGTSEISRKF